MGENQTMTFCAGDRVRINNSWVGTVEESFSDRCHVRSDVGGHVEVVHISYIAPLATFAQRLADAQHRQRKARHRKGR